MENGITFDISINMKNSIILLFCLVSIQLVAQHTTKNNSKNKTNTIYVNADSIKISSTIDSLFSALKFDIFDTKLSSDSIKKYKAELNKILETEVKPNLQKAKDKIKQAEIDKKIEEIRTNAMWDDLKNMLAEQQKIINDFYKKNEPTIQRWIDDFNTLLSDEKKENK